MYLGLMHFDNQNQCLKFLWLFRGFCHLNKIPWLFQAWKTKQKPLIMIFPGHEHPDHVLTNDHWNMENNNINIVQFFKKS